MLEQTGEYPTYFQGDPHVFTEEEHGLQSSRRKTGSDQRPYLLVPVSIDIASSTSFSNNYEPY